jgi:DNA-directed RNA polymerase specialized sigma24 family protein
MAVLIAIGGLLRTLFLAVLSRLFADEARAWMPHLVSHLLKRAVSQLPEHHRKRYDEEWASHLNENPGDLSKLWAAIGFVRASQRIWAANRRPGSYQIVIHKESQRQIGWLTSWQVMEMMKRLPNHERRMLCMLDVEEKDKDRVRQALGVPEDYLRILLDRAKEMFGEAYEGYAEEC